MLVVLIISGFRKLHRVARSCMSIAFGRRQSWCEEKSNELPSEQQTPLNWFILKFLKFQKASSRISKTIIWAASWAHQSSLSEPAYLVVQSEDSVSCWWLGPPLLAHYSTLRQPRRRQPECDRWDWVPLAISKRWLIKINDWVYGMWLMSLEWQLVVHTYIWSQTAQWHDWNVGEQKSKRETCQFNIKTSLHLR